MAGKYQTMKLVAKINQDERYYQGVYRCKVCHGVLIDRGLNSLVDSPANDDSQIVNWACPLCDTSAPLSRRYRMALCTVGWRCPGGNIVTDTAPIGFPSFEKAYSGYQRENIKLFFCCKGTAILASDTKISLLQQRREELFEDVLDGRPDQLLQKTHMDRQALARDVVQRCLNDMRLEQSREEA